MNSERSYDVAIVGGGLAGLCAAIMLAQRNFRVILFEKEKYPFHKVCGEYISLESRDLILSLGVKLDDWQLPAINELSLTSPDGNELHQSLPLGGFGVSRYKIDDALFNIAVDIGVDVLENTKVNDVRFADDRFAIQSDAGDYSARVCCNAAGKRSNLDVKWKRRFTQRKPNALNNYIGVKYHAIFEHPRNVIALHNFNNGYCGISPIEDNKTCICYLTTAANLRQSGNDIGRMQENKLFRNPFLKEAFENSGMLYDKPLTISQISFDKKEQVLDHVIMLGDSAGMIAPLCGNGMSMALFSSKMAVGLIADFLRGKISRSVLEASYIAEWNKAFSKRLFAGRVIQSFFGKEWLTNTTVGVLKRFPSVVSRIVRQTHG